MKVFANCDDSLQKDKGLGCSLMKALDVPLYGRALKPRKVLLQNQHGACWWALYLSTPSLEWLMPRYRQWTNGINIIFMFSPTNSLKSSAFSGNYISPLCYVSIDLLLLHGGYHLLGLLKLKRCCNAPEEWRMQLEILNSMQTPKCPLRGQDGRKEKIHFSICVNTTNRERNVPLIQAPTCNQATPAVSVQGGSDQFWAAIHVSQPAHCLCQLLARQDLAALADRQTAVMLLPHHQGWLELCAAATRILPSCPMLLLHVTAASPAQPFNKGSQLFFQALGVYNYFLHEVILVS